jgi:O-acetylserine/cysteine efflux transporter
VIVVWAFNFIAGKVGVTQLPPLFLIALRFALVALLLAPFLRPLGSRWRPVAVLSLSFGVLHFGPLFVGLQGVDAGPAAIAGQLTVPFSALLAYVFYRETLGVGQVVGMLTAFAGVYWLAGGAGDPLSLPHFFLIVFGAFSWSMANILIKRLGAINVFQLNAWIALLATPQLMLASLLLESGHRQAIAAADWQAWGSIVYMSVAASIVAYGLWYYLVGKYAVNRVVPLTLLAPVLAVVFAVWLLDEPLGEGVVLGGLVTLVGVAMIQFLRPRLPDPAEPS